jgi:hypothetical protein
VHYLALIHLRDVLAATPETAEEKPKSSSEFFWECASPGFFVLARVKETQLLAQAGFLFFSSPGSRQGLVGRTIEEPIVRMDTSHNQ